MTTASRARRAVVVGLLTAVAVGYVAWESYRGSLRAQVAIEEREQSRRVDALLVARALERDGAEPNGPRLRAALAGSGVRATAAVYAPGGVRLAAASNDPDAPPEASLPVAPPRLSADPRPEVVEGIGPEGADGAALTWVPLRSGAVLLLAQPGARAASWLQTLIAYQLLTLVVVLAGVSFALWRVRRAMRPRNDGAQGRDVASDQPRREAEFVVETFQSVIGELQLKGRELEQARRYERERADRSERFSERVIAQMPTGLVVVDRSGRITAANASAREIFPGLPAQRSDATRFAVAFAEAPTLVALIDQCLQEAASSHRMEVEMLADDGARRWLGVSVSAIAGDDARAEAALCLLTELTEVIALRDRVRVQENLASLGEMAAGLAHELKNSLATIQGYGQLLARIVPADAAVPSAALVEEVRQLTQMVTDFLNFARPQKPLLAPTQLAAVLEGALARAADAIERGGVEVTVDCPDGLIVLADEVLLGRAVLNVVQNAVEALEEAPPPRRLEIRAAPAAGRAVMLELRDTGPGIAPGDLSRIFIPFFTTKTRGHGIGLALTYKILTAHDGFVTVENAHPGARFRCVLQAPPIAADGRSEDRPGRPPTVP